MQVPCLSRWSSRLFATDPAAFVARGRALAAGAGSPAWAFWLPTARAMLGERVTVVASREHAGAVLQGPSVFLDGEVLAPLLGRTSALLDLPTAKPATHPPMPSRAEVRACLEAALEVRPARRPFDLAGALHVAAIRLACRMLDANTLAACQTAALLLRCADTPALVCPPLRAVSPRWRMLAKARAAFLAAAEVPSSEAEEDAAVTLLVGAVDAPVALACEAVRLAGTRNPEILGHAAVAATLRRSPPVPLLLRRATLPIELAGVGVIRPGEAVAVDAGAAGLPFGLGPHACSGARLGRMFAEEAVAACQRLGVRVLPQRVRYVRRRLVVAPERLMCERT